MKKTISLLLAALMLLCALPALADDAPVMVGMPNPMSEYESIAGIVEDHPEIEIEEPPEGAENVQYFVIDVAEDYAIADIQFTLNGIDYDYRCVQRDEDDTFFDKDTGYLAGMFYDFDVETVETVDVNGTPCNMGLFYCSADQTGFVSWYDFDAGCAYSLSAAAPKEAILETGRALVRSNLRHTSVEGVLVSYVNDVITLNLKSGSIIRIPCENDVNANAGDTVRLTYTGDLLNKPYVISVTVVSAGGFFAGTVTAHDDRSVTVKAASGSMIVFALSKDTVITGEDTEIKNNAQVSVSYTGSLTRTVTALEICIDVPGEETDPKLIDKELTGTVTKLTKTLLSIRTSKGKKYSFVRTSDTEYSGKHTLKVNCTVKVRYDGYAADTPDAKEITVTKAAPKPTPEPEPTPKLRKAEGIVTAVCGIWITLDDGHVYTVNSSQCKIIGPDYCGVGARAVFRYYKSGSDRICTQAQFEIKVY